jgi:hypothetical protein
MKKVILFAVFAGAVLAFMSSCSRGITPDEAANGKAKCGRYLR